MTIINDLLTKVTYMDDTLGHALEAVTQKALTSIRTDEESKVVVIDMEEIQNIFHAFRQEIIKKIQSGDYCWR